MLLALLRLDRAVPQAGLWALVALSVSTGFLHGALDAGLLQQRFQPRWRASAWGVLYVGVVVLLGWALGHAVDVALWALLLMSAWHFGEPYGRWSGVAATGQGLTRIVVGGAPVMLPMLVSETTLAALLAPVVPAGTVVVWHGLALAWLCLLLVWAATCGLPRVTAARHAWAELLAAGLLNAAFSPLMAFALYFGAYHSPVHMWRVWRSWRTDPAAQGRGSRAVHSRWSVAVIAVATVGLTLAIGAGLWWWLGVNALGTANPVMTLRWLIVVLTALTAPHLVLISLCARWLSAPDAKP